MRYDDRTIRTVSNMGTSAQQKSVRIAGCAGGPFTVPVRNRWRAALIDGEVQTGWWSVVLD